MKQLRPYQAECLERLLQLYRQGRRRVLVSLPTPGRSEQDVVYSRRLTWIVGVALATIGLGVLVVAANARADSPPLDTIVGYAVMTAVLAGSGLLLAEGARLLVVFIGGAMDLPDKAAQLLGRSWAGLNVLQAQGCGSLDAGDGQCRSGQSSCC